MNLDNTVHDSNSAASNDSSIDSYIWDMDTELSALSVTDQDSNAATEDGDLQEFGNAGLDAHLWGYFLPFQCSDDRPRIDFWRAAPCITIGRELDNMIVLEGHKISAHHCVLTWDGNDNEFSVVVHDLSQNGTFINGWKVGQNQWRILRDGSEISFGDIRYIYRHAALPAPQTDFDINYELTPTILGTGSFGVVQLAIHKSTGICYAVKIVEKTKEMNAWDKISQEIGIMEGLGHRNICRLHEAFISEGVRNICIRLILEHVEGGNLKVYIDARYPNGLPELQVMDIVYQICDGMAYVHSKGIAHRDLKPENILLTKDVLPLIKIADFGLSKEVGGMTELRSVCGTGNYVAPEVAHRGLYDDHVDSFSLGAILYFMLTGEEAFAFPSSVETEKLNALAGTPKLIMAVMFRVLSLEKMDGTHISGKVRDLIRCLLDNDPRKRPSMKGVSSHPWLVDYVPIYGPSNWEDDDLPYEPQDELSMTTSDSEPHTPRAKGKNRSTKTTPRKVKIRTRARASVVRAPRQRAHLSPLREVDNTDADGDREMRPATPARMRTRSRANQENTALGRGRREKKPTWKILEMRR